MRFLQKACSSFLVALIFTVSGPWNVSGQQATPTIVGPKVMGQQATPTIVGPKVMGQQATPTIVGPKVVGRQDPRPSINPNQALRFWAAKNNGKNIREQGTEFGSRGFTGSGGIGEPNCPLGFFPKCFVGGSPSS